MINFIRNIHRGALISHIKNELRDNERVSVAIKFELVKDIIMISLSRIDNKLIIELSDGTKADLDRVSNLELDKIFDMLIAKSY